MSYEDGISRLCLTARQLPLCNGAAVIDYFALALTHGLLAIAVFRMLGRDDLDHEVTEERRGEDADGRRRTGRQDRKRP